MRKKVLAVFVLFLFVTSVLSFYLPVVSAEDETIPGTVVIHWEANKTHEKTHKRTIDSMKGKIEFDWGIVNFDNDLVFFRITDDDEEIYSSQNIESDSGEIEVQTRKYTFFWQNNNENKNENENNTDLNKSFLLSYKIKYPIPKRVATALS